MEVAEALTKLKFLVSHDRFKLVARHNESTCFSHVSKDNH